MTPVFKQQRKNKHHVLFNLQHGLTPMNSRHEHWNIKINEGKWQYIPPEDLESLMMYYN
jgi:hypothetical protein